MIKIQPIEILARDPTNSLHPTNINQQILDWDMLKNKIIEITNPRYKMNNQDRSNIIASFMDYVGEYNIKYGMPFHMSKKPNGQPVRIDREHCSNYRSKHQKVTNSYNPY